MTKLHGLIAGDCFMKNVITSVTATSWFGYLARIVLTYMFWASGIAKLVDFQAAVGEMAHFGLNPPAAFAVATAIVQLVGSALIILNRWTWLGAGMLGVFTALTIPIAHNFWSMEEPFKTIEFYVVMEHITVIGALMVVAWKAEQWGQRAAN
jgi:transmembrane protein